MENLSRCPCCNSKTIDRMIMPIPKNSKRTTKVWCYYCGVQIDIEIEVKSKWYRPDRYGNPIYEDDPRWVSNGWAPVVRDNEE